MDVAALVTAGATTVVGLMASDAWKYASGRFARLLGRGEDDPGQEEALTRELRASRAELLLARADGDEVAADRVEEAWRDRLREVLRQDEAAARELAQLLDEVNPGWREPAAPTVSNTISGGTFNAQVYQGRDFGSITLDMTRLPPPNDH
ncbi:hypothetical protein [Streptomyces sp. NBC_00091]|uniref:hypothetical protein n=1 Tax=Streptomyces sp. NBC_00091 TaxID=2975648 RepID=UPI00225ACCF2|nr:hypothetical protein [Streptomyces sp. NBC_00091]MCX5377828.1 hypothetical protein [Streptomyces sp. NBC_00091]